MEYKLDPLFSSANTEWETPERFFKILEDEFHFDLDAAATAENTKVPGAFFTKEDDALHQSWAIRGKGTKVWCNPPYGREEVEPFVMKGYLESLQGVTSVFLLPARTDTNWFFDWVFCRKPTELSKADEARMVPGRLKFTTPGQKSNSAPFPSMVVIYRPYEERRNLKPGFIPLIPFIYT